jgi:hypothetical protein
LLLVTTFLGAQPAEAAAVDPNASYVLVNRHSGKALDVHNWSTANGGSIVQRAHLNAADQQWRLADSSDGCVRFLSRHSGKALEVQGASTADNAHTVQYDDWGGTNQQWQLVKVGGDNTGPCDPPGTYRWASSGPLAQPKPGWVSR